MGCPSLHIKRGKGRYNLSASCPSCYAGVEQRIYKEPVTHKEPACLKWIIPKLPKGRSTPEQRSQYYGWHLILEANLNHNNIPKETITILEKLFYKKAKPTKQQYQNLITSYSKKSARPTLVVRTLLDQIIKDTATIQEYSKKAGFSPRAQKLFQTHCNEFIQMIKEIQKFQ
ncbi:MAG: hypothetical protein WC915_06110 [archaeon]|jgi:hypothetical protein